jgi:hypothetical protein
MRAMGVAAAIVAMGWTVGSGYAQTAPATAPTATAQAQTAEAQRRAAADKALAEELSRAGVCAK